MMGSYPRTQQIRIDRRARAVEVQAANKRTPQEQLANLDRLGLRAVKERAKIAKKLQKENA
jgi:hypothetical protein